MLHVNDTNIKVISRFVGSLVAPTVSYIHLEFHVTGKLASLNSSWQSSRGTFSASKMAGIERMLSQVKSDWTPRSP